MRVIPAFCASAICALAPLQAMADCPVSASDADTGIWVRYADDAITRYRRDAEGLVHERTDFNDGTGNGYEFRSHRGVWVLAAADMVNGEVQEETRESAKFRLALADLPTPKPGLTWTGQAAVESPDIGSFTQEVTLSAGEAKIREIGGCSYEVIPVSVHYLHTSADIREELDYVPDLDIAIFTEISVNGATPEDFAPVEISTAEIKP